MRFALMVLAVSLVGFVSSCGGKRGTSECATPLDYVTNPYTSGEQAIQHASEYLATFSMGKDDLEITAKVDTASANLIVNGKDFDYGVDTQIGKVPFILRSGSNETLAINAKDSIDVGCIADFGARFALASKDSDIPNILGLAYGDPKKRPQEKTSPPFFDQLVKLQGLKNVFSLALCGSRGNSRMVLGGIDENMKGFVGDFIPVIEKSAFVIPALNLRLAGNKKVIAEFPHYDPETKTGIRTIIDSGSAFLILPSDMAKTFADTVKSEVYALNLTKLFPEGFFRTERSTSTKAIQFLSTTQIRQLPTFEINVLGADGDTKTLELSPLHYLKEIDKDNPLLRTFAVRETRGDVILGQPFLENHYTFFDRKNGLIGFGNIDVACAE